MNRMTLLAGSEPLLGGLATVELIPATSPHLPTPLPMQPVSFDAIKNPAAQWVAEMANADGVDPKTIRSAGLVKSMGQAVQNFKPGLVSKVIDENGEPLVVYHGADEKQTTANDPTSTVSTHPCA